MPKRRYTFWSSTGRAPSTTDPGPADRDPNTSRGVPDETFKQTLRALGILVERNIPWLLDFGSWIFAGLIAFTLVVVAALLTVGPVDPAILVSAAAFGLALPPDVAGFFLLRLVKDMEQEGLEKDAAQAFQEVGIAVGEQVASPQAIEAALKKRRETVLRYSYLILAASLLLTLTGMTAALWHMAWWIGVVFLAMVPISVGIVVGAIASASVLDPPPGAAGSRTHRP